MDILVVHIRVKPEFVDAFREATLANARGSIQEPGIARFDVLQHKDDPTRFVLIEAYRSPDARDHHRETDHYQTWNKAVAEMQAEPRTRAIYTLLTPESSSRA